MLHKYKMLPLVAVMLVMSLVFSAQAAPVVPDFVPLVQSAGKAVVNISTEKKVMQRGGMPSEMFRGLPPEFERFFEQFEGNSRNAKPRTQRSLGTGFLISSDGYIVTNYHVVGDADTVKVTLYNGDSYDAQYIGGDEDYDIAVIKIEATDLPNVTLGNSDSLNVGDHVLAIGNPLGELTFSMSEGIASSVNRAIDVDGTPFNMIQVTAAINPGNSGGPLFNEYGEVVGIVSAKYSSYASQSVEGLGFAIPINDVAAMIQDIMTNGYVSNKAYLGITPGTMNEQMAAQYRYDVTKGVFIYSVEEGSAADKAGLKMGDVIMKIDGTDVDSYQELVALKKKYSAGDESTFTIYRDGKQQEVSVTWGAVPADQATDNNSQSQQSQNNNSNSNNGSYNGGNGYYSNPWDIFNYYFGNQG